MELLAKHFGCTRFVYNYFLNQRQKQYKEEGESDNYYAQAKALNVVDYLIIHVLVYTLILYSVSYL